MTPDRLLSLCEDSPPWKPSPELPAEHRREARNLWLYVIARERTRKGRNRRALHLWDLYVARVVRPKAQAMADDRLGAQS